MLEAPSSFRMPCFRGWWPRIALKSLELEVKEKLESLGSSLTSCVTPHRQGYLHPMGQITVHLTDPCKDQRERCIQDSQQSTWLAVCSIKVCPHVCVTHTGAGVWAAVFTAVCNKSKPHSIQMSDSSLTRQWANWEASGPPFHSVPWGKGKFSRSNDLDPKGREATQGARWARFLESKWHFWPS